MDVPEKWGYRADALVACLMAYCALAVAIYGMIDICRSPVVRPYLLVFLLLELLWFGYFFHSLVMRAKHGHFTHAAWHVAIALPMACLSLLSLSVRTPQIETAFHSPMFMDRLIEHILLAIQWWIDQY